MVKISVVISAYNEENKIDKCLKSVDWADEIIFVDNSSIDNTVKIAQKYTSKIFRRQNNKMLNINKNFGISKATSPWILYLDADEIVPPELKQEIFQKISEEPRTKNQELIVGYWIPRKNILFGKWIKHGIWWPDKQLRFFRNGYGKYPCKHVHEYIRVDGPTKNLENSMLHNNYETINQYINKFNSIYADNEVDNLINTGYGLDWVDAIKFPVSDFVKIFFAQKGYQDGLHGLVLALLQSFYSFITFAKMWERYKFREIDLSLDQIKNELKLSQKEVKYWVLSSKINQEPNIIKKIIYKIHRHLLN